MTGTVTAVRVSALLSMYGLAGDASRWYTDAARDRGTTVHWLAEAVLRGRPVHCAPDMQGYRDALMRVRDVLKWEPVMTEERLTSQGITGRPDSVGLTPGAGKIPAGPGVLDVKSGAPMPSHGIQLALYEQLFSELGMQHRLPEQYRSHPLWRIGAYVNADGTYKLQLYMDVDDRIVAAGITSVTRWRLSRGLVPPQPEINDPAELGQEEFAL